MTGWRIGYCLGDASLIKGVKKINSQTTSNACSFAQIAAVEALSAPQSEADQMREAFQRRRDRVLEGVKQLPKVQCSKPMGAFYLFPDFSAYLGGEKLNDISALATHLLESEYVATVPGNAFGSPNHLRLTFCCSDAELDEGFARISKCLKSL